MSLRRLHFLSALLIGLFAAVHVTNHLAGLGGVEQHLAFMNSARYVYRLFPVELLLLSCVAFQVGSGLFFVVRGWHERKGLAPWLQAISGAYLAFFLLVHVGAVLFGRAALHLNTNFYYAAAGLHVAPYQWFFAPYYFLAVAALFLHLGCALYWQLQQRTLVLQRLVLLIPGGVGVLAGLLIVLMLAGALYPVRIPPAYLATYQNGTIAK